mmetsp:Transcript_13284/g.25603  ORF Transcript_13284/g.25603 Transcript_13284/m.25603 type:complete len:169 (-) Transcript_13284:249-755(-)
MASVASTTREEILQVFRPTGLEWLVPPERGNDPQLWDSLARYYLEQRRDPLDVPWSVAAPSWSKEAPWSTCVKDASNLKSSIPFGVPIKGHSDTLPVPAATRLSPQTEELRPAVSCTNGLVGSRVAFYEAASKNAVQGFEAVEKHSSGLGGRAVANRAAGSHYLRQQN